LYSYNYLSLKFKKNRKTYQKNVEKLPIFHLSPIRYRYIAKAKAPIRYNIDIMNIGNISRYFRHIDPPLPRIVSLAAENIVICP